MTTTEVEAFIYMRLSLLHSASATIAPAGSSWTNDSERALNTEEEECGFHTEELEGDTARTWG